MFTSRAPSILLTNGHIMKEASTPSVIVDEINLTYLFGGISSAGNFPSVVLVDLFPL